MASVRVGIFGRVMPAVQILWLSRESLQMGLLEE